jgi:hypothetical protein
MSESRNRRDGPHHNFLGGGRAGSVGLARGVGRAVVAAVATLRFSAAALRAMALGPVGLSGVILANAAPAAALLAA